jgi:hypothetical protein
MGIEERAREKRKRRRNGPFGRRRKTSQSSIETLSALYVNVYYTKGYKGYHYNI